MNKWLELLLGLILVLVPISLWGSWGPSALTVLTGGIFWVLVGVGILLVVLGIADLKG